MTNKHTLELLGEKELLFTRTFSAPCKMVWEAHTDCKHLVHWWGPEGWDLTHCELDLRPGGTWHYCMTGMYEGAQMESWGLTTYKEINPFNRLVYQDAFSDEDKTVNLDMPQTLTTLTLEETADGTLMKSLTQYESAEARQQMLDMGMEQGIAQTWDRLDTYFAK